MNALHTFLQRAVREAETSASAHAASPWHLAFHLEPPVGWLNDPNGLCQFQGLYHLFFQYSPTEPRGGLKFWGLYTSSDLLHWEYRGVPLVPDSPWDCHGVYSGSALVEPDGIRLFYTGNVKWEGKHDYIHSGRGSLTLTCPFAGDQVGPKQVALAMSDYPADCTNHVRDPKVWRDAQGYHLLLGARTQDDAGAALLYHSRDADTWQFDRLFTSAQPFGYMWECPDTFSLPDGEGEASFFLCSPQGLPRQRGHCQNVYSAGYFPLPRPLIESEGGVLDALDGANYVELDYGFDLYAPQTFLDESGRRLLLAWVGMPDSEDEYQNPTVALGYQHALSTLRVLTARQGRLFQWPAEEYETLRGEVLWHFPEVGSLRAQAHADTMDLELSDVQGEGEFRFGDGCLRWTQNEVSLSFGSSGCGRTERVVEVPGLHHVRVLLDRSLLEVFLNEGASTLTARFYPETTPELRLQATGRSTAWRMNAFPQ